MLKGPKKDQNTRVENRFRFSFYFPGANCLLRQCLEQPSPEGSLTRAGDRFEADL